MNNITKHFKYGWYVLKHKYWVLIYGLKLGAPLWNLLVHDLSKLSKAEWLPYVNFFYGEPDKKAFMKAWNHHVDHNPHHWNYWLLNNDKTKAYPMHITFVKEMVADWISAGKCLKGNGVHSWYENNKDKMVLNKLTQEIVEDMLKRIPNGT